MRWLPALIVAAGLAACSSTAPVSSSAPTSPSAPPPVSASASGDLCATWNDLKTSVSDLQKIDVVSGGTNAIQSALQNVQTKFDAFHNAARDQFAPQIKQMSDALSNLQRAVQAMAASPGVSTIGSAVTAASGVVAAFTALQGAVSTRCG
jgi:hypothetical protein